MSKAESFGRFDFVGKAWLFGGISILLVLFSLGYIAVRGMSWGLDFRGGTEIQIRFSEPVAADEIRQVVGKSGIGDVGVQAFGENNEFILRFQGKPGKTEKETNENLNSAIASLKKVIETDLGSRTPDFRRVDTVGPQVGAELKRSGFLAVFYSLLVILVYVALRFDYKYSPGAVACLFHDALISLAIYEIMGKEVNIATLAAILTLIGYSLNDTIVVFDRIRETEDIYRGKGMAFIINRAINDMLGRTLVTAGTTLISAICLVWLGTGVVEDIALVMAIGIVIGTYSSIYVAAPFVLLLDKLKAARAS
ncbi:MAG: protein translocase subunit SecF [Bdellovibrionaceae bacterium]|nr:protein translocase subunit SecF [Pseudobdellovibrionaceae bacterium]